MTETMGKLIIARHHESEWNKLGQWTGIRDTHLTEYGFEKSAEMGHLLSDMHIDRAFASMKVRTIESLSCMLEALGQFRVPTLHSDALNERDYGDYTGKNKWEMQKEIGVEAWNKVRRDFDYPVPNGETLKDVYNRVIPFYTETILPLLEAGKNVLIVAHGNSLRALMKYLEGISDEDIANVEMPFGTIFIYSISKDGLSAGKEARSIESKVNA